MSSLRKFIYASLLVLTTLNLASALASAQTSRGRFRLNHSVLWGKAIVPAGEYAFNYSAEGPTGLLRLTKLDSPHAGFMFLVTDAEESRPSDTNKLTLQRISTGSYVRAMTLADDRIILYFAPPPRSAGRVIAAVATQSLASGR
jgi:hypothetical protein